MNDASPVLAEQIEGLEHLNRKGWYYISRISQQLAQETAALQGFLEHYYAVVGRLTPEDSVVDACGDSGNNNKNAPSYHQATGIPDSSILRGEGGETPNATAALLHREQKRLYRRIIRRCHPDAAAAPSLAADAAYWLAQAENAYRRADSAALGRLAMRMERETLPPQEYADFLRQNCRVLEQELAQLRDQLKTLRHSAAYRLHQRLQSARQRSPWLLTQILRQVVSQSMHSANAFAGC